MHAAPAVPLDALATALDRTGDLLAGLGADEWSSPTPCTGWTVRDLVNHLVGGNRLFTDALRGVPLPPREVLGRRAREDRLGGDPVGTYRDGARALLAAVRAPGALDGVLALPAGELPGPAAVHLRTVELLVHGWDLATATGRPVPFPDELAAAELQFSRDLLARMPEERRPFAPPQPVADDAPALDRLAALLGRRVDGREVPAGT